MGIGEAIMGDWISEIGHSRSDFERKLDRLIKGMDKVGGIIDGEEGLWSYSRGFRDYWVSIKFPGAKNGNLLLLLKWIWKQNHPRYSHGN
ncbi:hypothetical protein AALP_AA3G285800 [Arabis alpina]|uniref:Uncharacterized protein n=1 Tax=Arabis alpina TaxID=50452 RepID=A0A087HCC1_ARAAL|nr:hypothetical protein AALP_AA3G285800 [Arabis alpina]